jgi:hypothetical protein
MWSHCIKGSDMTINMNASLTMNSRQQGTLQDGSQTEFRDGTWLTTGHMLAAICMTLLILAGGLMADNEAGLAASTEAQQPTSCIALLEDFCPGQPMVKTAGKRRTLAFL